VLLTKSVGVYVVHSARDSQITLCVDCTWLYTVAQPGCLQ